MKNKITESEIENYAIELLEKQGYKYIYAPSIAPDSETPERQSFEDVLLKEQLHSAVGRINTSSPADVLEDAVKQIQGLNSPELIANNEAFHRMLTEGIKVTYQIDGQSLGESTSFTLNYRRLPGISTLRVKTCTIKEQHYYKTAGV